MKIKDIGKNAKDALKDIRKLRENDKNGILKLVAEALLERKDDIIKANKIDLANAKENGMNKALLDRLLLDDERIKSIADGLVKITGLEDPIGKVLEMNKRPNGLMIGKKVVPIGVIGIIYEARPNVTIDAFGLCFKTSNCVILRGGKEAINSNVKLVEVVNEVFINNGINPNCLQILRDTSREIANEMMKMNEYLDLLIPRGGSGLINAVIQNSTIPVIQTGVGNCHVYIDKYADLEKALNIAYNSKVQRPGVCNSCETILVHKDICNDFLPKIQELFKNKVEVRGDKKVLDYFTDGIPATESDYLEEFHDYIVAMKVVDTYDEAILHIQKYSTGHSEAIVTENFTNAQEFLEEIDSAAVYVNASTRFTDGFEFGFGAEIGISTQKLHARGPMGLLELTTTKYIIYGSGQIRE
ncbi:glutamate-5-semialdehyde dehydrogenase [Mycoplasmatota bacterium]|nr:glutamate-5-semialdehyde dehydrogenase [Mycoplasmatota bacterium]